MAATVSTSCQMKTLTLMTSPSAQHVKMSYHRATEPPGPSARSQRQSAPPRGRANSAGMCQFSNVHHSQDATAGDAPAAASQWTREDDFWFSQRTKSLGDEPQYGPKLNLDDRRVAPRLHAPMALTTWPGRAAACDAVALALHRMQEMTKCGVVGT